MVIGHEWPRTALGAAIGGGRVVLCHGLPGIGKWLVAQEAALAYGGSILELRGTVTIDEARALVRLTESAPVSDRLAVALVDLDDLSYRATNVLLKALEELPDWLCVILVAGKPPIPTVASRITQRIWFDALSTEEVTEVLVETFGYGRYEAEDLAKLSRGDVATALVHAESWRQKPVLMSFLDALVRHDEIALGHVSREWDFELGKLFERWFLEASAYSLTRTPARWYVFDEGDLAILSRLGTANAYQITQMIREGFGPQAAARNIWSHV